MSDKPTRDEFWVVVEYLRECGIEFRRDTGRTGHAMEAVYPSGAFFRAMAESLDGSMPGLHGDHPMFDKQGGSGV